ncbi:protein kinase [Geodermatophilus sp. DSM 45219]|uniref:protein kinase domain-containing protein n=1 Tax=Geodermatophilus sp. DSM 45219 TaxID=1881103 RepID=UPI00088EFD21|nr:protein kinase [Geodermatophilus sp. DSM 45219]SDO05638.1 serine/threonine protein kinase [Geodermatophilus sp. DSM 45219]
MAEPGVRTLDGRYELLSLLATGGMGQVWRGHDALLDRQVAVKVLRSEFTGDPTFLARFRAEAQHTARLVHPNIAALHDYGEVVTAHGETLAYLVMELVEGEPLSALLARRGRLDPQRTLDVVRQTAAALAVAHAAGVVHRDVKPGNVLVGWDGVVKITDFGIAWSASSVPLTGTGQVVGTAHYLSPEQAEGGKAGPASDVYALGAITYECLAGRRAFDGESPVQIALAQIRDEPEPLPDDVPAPVRTLVARALVKDPALRFPDGAAFRAAVDAVRAGRALAPLPPPTTPLPAAGPRRSRVLVPAAALLLGAALGVGALQVAGGEDPGTPVAVADTEAPSPAQVEPVAALVVTAADHLGRPADEVEAALAALGLRVGRVTVERSDVPAGQVVELGPVGALSPGDLVTLTVAASPPPPPPAPAPAPAPAPDPAPAPAPVVVVEPAPAPVAPPAPEPAPAPDQDEDDEESGPGKAKGKDRDSSGRGNDRDD